MPVSPGTHLGPYLVQESIGQGAMGVVYRAYHEQLERTGAVKVLQALSPDEDTTARFRREAQAIAHMRHPNVLNVFDFGEHEGVPYMIVEYVEGGSLAGRLKRADLTPAQALHYLRGIGSALDYAHSLGIVHRDVKPANVLLGPADTPILADFGLAKLLQSSSIKSITGVTTGTPAYMAPEQVTGSEVGPAADRYSLAVMAFEMLAGTLPFDEAGVLEVLYAHVHREPPQPSTRNATLTNRVDAIILRGLAKDPQSRWESCDAFVSALERALLPAEAEAERTIAYATQAPVAVPRPDAPPRTAAPARAVAATMIAAPPAPPPVAATAPPEKEKRRRRLGFLWIAAALILLLLVGTAAVVALNRPTLDVRPARVAVGGRITVLATHVPKGQVGTIQIHSRIEAFDFRADSNGDVLKNIDLPLDIEPGTHQVELCWDGTCRVHQPLLVVSGGVAEVSPGTTPSSSPTQTPGSTPSTNPTPGKSPTPKPSSSPTSNPTHNPTPSPSPQRSPSPSPSPSCSSSGAALTESPNPVAGGANATIKGSHFTPGTVTLYYYRAGALVATSTATVQPNCSFSGTLTTKVTLVPRTDKVTAEDSAGHKASVSFSVIA